MNEGQINEQLFHGTSQTDPQQICEGEEGFDMRFRTQGRWGQGNYFAVSASYSNRFAHGIQDGYKLMFLANVLTGISCYSPPDSSLRMPPLKQRINFAQARYDSVNGISRGS